MFYLSDKTRRRIVQKGGILRLSADIGFQITRTKRMQTKNWFNICLIALQGITLSEVYKNQGSTQSVIEDRGQRSNFEV